MKIIIVYASAGGGHFKAAQAIYNHFKKNDPNINVKLIDALDYSSPWFKSSYRNGYAFMINYTPWLWGLAFYFTYAKGLRPFISRIYSIINRWNTAAFTNILINENPDFIISTHFLPSDVISYLKRIQKISSKLITVITDFGLHPFWLSNGTDIYIAASDFTKEELILNGVKEEIVKVLGIPIDQKFLLRYEKDILFKKFNMDQDKFTVLILTGSFGIGPIEKIVDLLHKEVQILAVCAKNRNLFARLKNKNYSNLMVFGFVDNIEELMAVSDIIITKPGGMTISEALAVGIVPIFISAIPGQETTNLEVLKRYGIGLGIKNIDDLKDLVLDYKADPDKLNMVRQNMAKLKKPSAVQELYNVICQCSAGDTC